MNINVFHFTAAVANATIHAAVATSLTNETKINAKLASDDAENINSNFSPESGMTEAAANLNYIESLTLVESSIKASNLALESTNYAKETYDYIDGYYDSYDEEFYNIHNINPDSSINRINTSNNLAAKATEVAAKAIYLANETNVKIAIINEFNEQYIKNLNDKTDLNKVRNINISTGVVVILICGSAYVVNSLLKSLFNRY
jgi:hypothetical protein